MPITKRIAYHGTSKTLLNYILDEKHNAEKVGVVSSINCNVETAILEFKDLQNKYKMKGNRVAYHIIQSFSPKDNIIVEQANEIGKKLCKELYPNFQCVISTHIDKGHIHNHIAVNSINLNGIKLEDRLANEKEGLYGLSDASDKIAKEYGCFVMPQKTYLNLKNKDYYYQYREQSWNDKIKEDIEGLLVKCNSIDELLDKLSILGYEIRRGKYISVKCFGMKKFARLQTIDECYSNKNLYRYFKSIEEKIKRINLQELQSNRNEYNSRLLTFANESKTAIEKSQLSAEGKKYSNYQRTRYQEIKRYYKLKEKLEFLDSCNIKSFYDMEREIENKRNLMKGYNISLKNYKENYKEILTRTEKAQDYIRLYKGYEYALYYKESDSNYRFPKEVEIFLDLQKELEIESIEEAKEIIKKSRDTRVAMNELKKKILFTQRELNQLDTIKEEKLSDSKLFIHNIKFGSNHIDFKNSTDDKFCILLPYTNEKIYIPKKYTAYNEKYEFYTLYLVDDKLYELYNKDKQKIGNITGIELEKYVMDKKREIDSMNRKK